MKVTVPRFTKMIMNHNDHALALGKLLGSLQSLEFSLRAFLATAATGPKTAGNDLATAVVGDEVIEDPFTDFHSLRRVITHFNSIMGESHGQLVVDIDMVDLRDALAHGRISAATPSFPLRLLKFARPRNGRVRVTHAFELTPEWFEQQTRRVTDEIVKVHAAAKAFGHI